MGVFVVGGAHLYLWCMIFSDRVGYNILSGKVLRIGVMGKISWVGYLAISFA